MMSLGTVGEVSEQHPVGGVGGVAVVLCGVALFIGVAFVVSCSPRALLVATVLVSLAKANIPSSPSRALLSAQRRADPSVYEMRAPAAEQESGVLVVTRLLVLKLGTVAHSAARSRMRERAHVREGRTPSPAPKPVGLRGPPDQRAPRRGPEWRSS
jgi:hypothetical protein